MLFRVVEEIEHFTHAAVRSNQIKTCEIEAGNLHSMSKQKQSITKYKLHETGNLLEEIASKIGSYEGQEWKLPENKSSLEAIVGTDKTAELYSMGNSKESNIHLRSLLSGPLKDKSHEVRLAAIEWVVYDWGNVRGNSEKHELWPKQLQNYQTEVIDKFIEDNYQDRIASWSKVLAFADSSKYAIFDARVAMSLNAILDDIGYRNRFYMPPPSSQKLGGIFSHTKSYVAGVYKGTQPQYLGYFDYKDLLDAMVDKGLAKNVLDVEMRLFANGEIYANIYASKHGLKLPFPKQPTNLPNAS